MRNVSRARFIALAALLPCGALAQTPLIVDQNRSDRQPASTMPAQAPVTAPPAELEGAPLEPFVLQSVRITGSSLAPDLLSSVIRPYIGKKAGKEELKQLVDAVAEAYAKKGEVAIYTIAVPPQDFANGQLQLAAVEGFIEHVDLAGDVQADNSLITAYAARLMQERPLKRATLERYLSLIREIPGLSVEAKLVAGRERGAVRLILALSRKPQHIEISVNDTGSNSLGRVQMQGRASLYGLLREGEKTTLTLGFPAEIGRFQYVSLAESHPLGADGSRAEFAFGYLRTRPRHPSPSGTAKTMQLVFSHPLLLGYDERLTAIAGIDGIDSSNATLGEIVANERIRAARLSAAYSSSGTDWALGLNLTASFGLDALGATTANPAFAQTVFRKLGTDVRFNWLVGPQWIVRLRAAAQLAFGPLPTSELYTIGGANFGSAFQSATAMGDSALAGAAEIAYAPPQNLVPGGTEIFAFADDGGTWYRARGPFAPQDFELASAGLGVRFPIGGKTKLELRAANGIVGDAPQERPGRWRFGFQFSFAQ